MLNASNNACLKKNHAYFIKASTTKVIYSPTISNLGQISDLFEYIPRNSEAHFMTQVPFLHYTGWARKVE